MASPFSLSACMALVYLATSGTTKTELQDGLSYPKEEETFLKGFKVTLANTVSDDTFTLEKVNKLYIQEKYQILKDYLAKVSKYLLAEIENIDFASNGATEVVNKWVEKKTNQKIKELLPQGIVTSDTRAILVNAIHFKSEWKKFFKKTNTEEGKFSLLGGNTVKVQMMTIGETYTLLHSNTLGCSVLEIPYKEERLSFIIFLPDKAEDFLKMEKTFLSFDFTSLKACQEQTHLLLSVPKFSLDTTHKLVEPLKKIGISKIFDYRAADFSKLTSESGLEVAEIIQKVHIEVDEEGTEAAVATVVQIQFRCGRLTPPNQRKFALDRPFTFVIRDNVTSMLLFIGRVVNPNES